MSPELEEKLVNDFPDLFARVRNRPITNTPYFGCDCADGWFPLVYELCGLIADHVKREKAAGREIEVSVLQVKEKFGGLRFYSTGAAAYISDAIRRAEALSYRTCEVTGRPGELYRKPNGWLVTLCPEEAEKTQARLYAEVVREREQATAQQCADGT